MKNLLKTFELVIISISIIISGIVISRFINDHLMQYLKSYFLKNYYGEIISEISLYFLILSLVIGILKLIFIRYEE
jgi:hypothetical protein